MYIIIALFIFSPSLLREVSTAAVIIAWFVYITACPCAVDACTQAFLFGCFCLHSAHWNLLSENFTFLTLASTLGSLAALVTDIATHCSADRPMGRPKRILHRYIPLRSTGSQPYRLGKSSLTAPILPTASKRRARRELWESASRMRTRSNYITGAIYSLLFDRTTSRLGQSYSIVSVHDDELHYLCLCLWEVEQMVGGGTNGGKQFVSHAHTDTIWLAIRTMLIAEWWSFSFGQLHVQHVFLLMQLIFPAKLPLLPTAYGHPGMVVHLVGFSILLKPICHIRINRNVIYMHFSKYSNTYILHYRISNTN